MAQMNIAFEKNCILRHRIMINVCKVIFLFTKPFLIIKVSLHL